MSLSKLAILVFFLSSPLTHAYDFAADFSGGYRWGTYSNSSLLEDSHAGAEILIRVGYRLLPEFEIGMIGSRGFQQISPPHTGISVPFNYQALGAYVGYLWRQKLEPWLAFYPYARLTQNNGNGNEPVYHGSALGIGMKVYLTEREKRTAQLGLLASYERSWLRAETGFSKSTKGDSYTLGVFVGI